MSPDREPGWVLAVAQQNGWAFADHSTSSLQDYVVSGDLGAAGGHRSWECTVRRHYLADGGAEDEVRWVCPGLQAARPELDTLLFLDSGAGGLGATGTLGDAGLIGAGVAVAWWRRQRRPAGPVTDVLELFTVQDPAALVTGPVAELIAHWPVVEAPAGPVVAAIGKFLGTVQLPPDAPPRSLSIGMTMHTPLTVTSQNWWLRGPWLEHQIRLGIALGLAAVAAGSDPRS